MRLRTLREAVETAAALGCPVALGQSHAPGIYLPLAEAQAVAALVEQALELTNCEDQVLFYRHLARLRRRLEGWR